MADVNSSKTTASSAAAAQQPAAGPTSLEAAVTTNAGSNCSANSSVSAGSTRPESAGRVAASPNLSASRPTLVTASAGMVATSHGPQPSAKTLMQRRLSSNSPNLKLSRSPSREVSESVAERMHNLSNMARSMPDTPATTCNDIFISYRHSDAALMSKLKDVLQKKGFSVWVDESSINIGANFIGKIGEGIINSKIFMCIVTESTYASRYCTDELCLAYIKEKPIYAVSLKSQAEMFAHIPTAIKLLVSRFEWTMACEESFQQDIEHHLVGKLRMELEAQYKLRLIAGGPTLPTAESQDVLSPLVTTPSSAGIQKQPLRKTQSRNWLYKRMNSRRSCGQSATADSPAPFSPAAGIWMDFWVKNFFNQASVPWQRFEDAFFNDAEFLKDMCEPSDKEWFVDILKRELGAEDGTIQKEKYKEFITDDEGTELCIFSCVTDLLRENIAMRKVFNLSSTVRIDAINDLAKFRSQAVVEALLDMLNDPEQDIRAAACLSLAKVAGGFESTKINRLRHCLKDEDRFVRQAACVALGYLKAEVAIADLLKIWRNDHIADVRYEAENALCAIGGAAVQNAIKATETLVKEIEDLSSRLKARSLPRNGYAQHKAQYECDLVKSRCQRHHC